jgi:2,4-dienoyl-CoA reductase-like NADH-dependent reductase (Old Yellow Enzyme family)
MADLLSSLTMRGVVMRNRIGVSPMCMYSCDQGWANEWHLVHLGSRAVGGAGLVIAEATGVEARGRITPGDSGLWADDQVEPWARVTRFIRQHGAVAAVQLAHAGRKAGCPVPWSPLPRGTMTAEQGGWQPVGASAAAFDSMYAVPTVLSEAELGAMVTRWLEAAQRAVAAGFEVIEIHAAHGYLLHSFHSPLSNTRTDRYGGGFDGRTRLTVEIARAIRGVMPEGMPLLVRLSCSDWCEGGWTIEESVELSRRLKAEGVDLIDCSSGGAVNNAELARRGGAYPNEPGFQVPFAERIRREAGIATAAVGLITEAKQADAIIREGRADVVLLAKGMLRDPYWPIHAARALGRAADLKWPAQYDYFVGKE